MDEQALRKAIELLTFLAEKQKERLDILTQRVDLLRTTCDAQHQQLQSHERQIIQLKRRIDRDVEPSLLPQKST